MRVIVAIFLMLLLACTVFGKNLQPRRAAKKPHKEVKLRPVPIERGTPGAYFSTNIEGHEIVVVKFAEGTRTRMLPNGNIHALGGHGMAVANQIIRGINPVLVKRLSPKNPDSVEARRARRETACGKELADMNTYFKVEVSSLEDAETLINSLLALDVIETAYLEPVYVETSAAEDIPPTTPNFDSIVFFRSPAPDGMGCEFSHTVPGGDGEGVQLIHLEHAWLWNNGTDSAHEDVPLDSATAFINQDTALHTDWPCEDCYFAHSGATGIAHARAISGLIWAQDNGYGITGAATGVTLRLQSIYWTCPPIHMPMIDMSYAIEQAIDSSAAGDVITASYGSVPPNYPVDTPWYRWILNYPEQGPGDTLRSWTQFGLVPLEATQALYDLIASAWADSVIFVASAANGTANLSDTSLYDSIFYRDYRNSHAIYVGAAWPGCDSTVGGSYVDQFTGNPYVQNSGTEFTNWDTSGFIQLYAHGRMVANGANWVGWELDGPTGYPLPIDGLPFEGDSADGWDEKQYYGNGFGGTSSAAPLVASAIACFQGAWKAAHNDSVLTGDSIVAIFQATGTPAQPDDSGWTAGIGYMPDLRAAFKAAGLVNKDYSGCKTLNGVTIH